MNALAEIVFDDARGGRKPRSKWTLEVARELTVEDLPGLSQASATPAQRLLQIRHAHHNLARLVAQGLEGAEVSLITGYSQAYISNIQNDPAFAELLQYYATQREQVFVNVLERMKVLGVSTLEELQQRLEQEPGKFSNRELMELAETTLVKPQLAGAKGQGVAAGPGVGVNIEVKFVGAPSRDGDQALDITPGGAR